MLVRSDEVQLAVRVVQDGESEFKHLLQEIGKNTRSGKGPFVLQPEQGAGLPVCPEKWLPSEWSGATPPKAVALSSASLLQGDHEKL